MPSKKKPASTKGATPETIEAEIIEKSAERVRASSKLRHHVKLLRVTIDSIKVFMADASDQAKAEAAEGLEAAAADIERLLSN